MKKINIKHEQADVKEKPLRAEGINVACFHRGEWRFTSSFSALLTELANTASTLCYGSEGSEWVYGYIREWLETCLLLGYKKIILSFLTT